MREIYPGTEDADLPESALAIARITMLVQMSCGAEATGASYLDYQRLEKEFMESVGGLAGAVRPSDNANVFMIFMCWLVAAKEKGSLVGITGPHRWGGHGQDGARQLDEASGCRGIV